MTDSPSLLIEFDPLTWEMTAIYFLSSSTQQTERLREILIRGVKVETLLSPGGHCDA